MKFIVGLLFGILIAGGIVWYLADQRGDPAARDAKSKVEALGREAKQKTEKAIDSIDWNTDTISKELADTGKVIRRKAKEAGNAIADATADMRTTAVIKAKLVADTDLSSLGISVNTTEGRVTLSGKASSPEQVRKAMQLALDQPGVNEVISTLVVK